MCEGGRPDDTHAVRFGFVVYGHDAATHGSDQQMHVGLWVTIGQDDCSHAGPAGDAGQKALALAEVLGQGDPGFAGPQSIGQSLGGFDQAGALFEQDGRGDRFKRLGADGANDQMLDRFVRGLMEEAR